MWKKNFVDSIKILGALNSILYSANEIHSIRFKIIINKKNQLYTKSREKDSNVFISADEFQIT